MKCYYHPNQEIVATCTECGKGLCKACASKWEPVLCDDCAKVRIENMKSENKKKVWLGIAIFVVFLVIGIVETFQTGDIVNILSCCVSGYVLASVPSGWRALTNIQPSMFLFLPLVGWLIYFGLKFVLSIFVGIIKFPTELIKFFAENKEAKQMEEQIR